MFVWRMDGIAVETESHQDGFAFEFFFEQGYNRNTSARTHRNGWHAKSFGIRFIRRLIPNLVRRDAVLLLPSRLLVQYFRNVW